MGDNLHVYEGASAKSAELGKILKNCLCCILAHGHGESSWLLVEWPDGIGWVRCKNDKGTPLLDQKWPCVKYLEELRAPLVTSKVNLPNSARAEVRPQDASPCVNGTGQPNLSKRLGVGSGWFFRARK